MTVPLGLALAALLFACWAGWAVGKRRAARGVEALAGGLDAVPVALFVCRGTSVLQANLAAAHLVGRPREALAGADLAALFGPGGAGLAPAEPGDARRVVLPLLPGAREEGDERWVDVTAREVVFAGAPAFLAAALDVTTQKRSEERILFRAMHDELTGLPNRHLLLERVAGAMASSRRRVRVSAILAVDLDRFTVINETLGHAAGDALLRETATRLKGAVRESDVVARMGSDDFGLLLADLADAGDAAQVAQKVQRAIVAPAKVKDTEVSVSASIGIALHPGDGADAETLLRRADVALSRAKKRGPGSIELSADEETASRALERLAMENALRQALQREEFLLFYQPQVGLASGRTESVEALLRWRRTEGPLTKPGQFIELAEESRLIVGIGAWVLRTACAQARAWHDAGHGWLKVAVNISAPQFQEPEFLADIERALAETGLPADRLELEITESAAMKDVEATVALLKQIRDRGIGVAIDDFGTGHSSLAYLRRFPITKVKIDGSFVRDLLADQNDAAIVIAIIDMARRMKLKTVAECVETSGQLAFLKEAGCDEVQGFLLGQPSPPEEVVAWFDERHVREALANVTADEG